jgi:protease I
MSKRLQGTRVLFVIAPQHFRDEEFLEPRKALEDEGIQITVASLGTELAKGMLGLEIRPEISLELAHSKDYQAIVVAGGSGTRHYLWGNDILHAILHDFSKEGKVIAAICLAPAILAETDLLEGVSATVYPSEEAKNKMVAGHALLLDQPVVKAGRIVTGRDPQAASAFGKAVVDTLLAFRSLV